MALAAGTRLGPYWILAPLGAGDMGEVYRTRGTRLGREVALEILPEDRSSDPGRLRRFESEVRNAAQIGEPYEGYIAHDGVRVAPGHNGPHSCE